MGIVLLIYLLGSFLVSILLFGRMQRSQTVLSEVAVQRLNRPARIRNNKKPSKHITAVEGYVQNALTGLLNYVQKPVPSLVPL